MLGATLRAWRWMGLILTLLLLAACATGGGGNKAPVDESIAQNKLAAGDFRGAADAFLELAKRNRKQRDHFQLLAADARREADDWATVDAILGEIKRKNLMGDDVQRIGLLDAEGVYRRGQYAQAVAQLSNPVLPAFEPRRLRLLSKAQAAAGDGLAAARSLWQLNALLPKESQRGNRNAIADLLAVVPIASLQQTLGQAALDDPLRPFIERALRKRGQVPARVVMRPIRPVGTQLPTDNGGWMREGFENVDQVAVLLPLSGEFESVGRAVLDGILTAYYAEALLRPRLKVFDSGASVTSAREALSKAKKDGAQRIIGPLQRDQVDALLEDGDESVHLLALNQSDDGSLPPKGSQTFGLLPEDEAAFIADALAQLGKKRIALFIGSEDWAQRFSKALKAQLDLLGGTLVMQTQVMSGAGDAALAVGEASAKTDLEAVILALRPESARLLAAQWKSSSLAAIPMYASSHVYSGGVARSADKDLEGVRFIDSPWVHSVASVAPSRGSMADELLSARASPRLFAFGMDAWRVSFYTGWLSGHEDSYLQGATGQLMVDPFGRINRIPHWMVFRDGVAVNSDGALETTIGGTN